MRQMVADAVMVMGFVFAAHAQVPADDERTLRAIADRVVGAASFQFQDRSGGRRYSTPGEAPPGSVVRLASPVNDWRYWNGVLNLAMMRVGEQLCEPRYGRFPERNVAFAFDHYRFFEARHVQESKWEYPFGQLFLMEELDDCGAMGAATIEVFRRDPQKRYREYLERAGNHVRTIQGRLPDGTLARSFPRRWTVWADDLYMGVEFLARMGELTADPGYFDDAAAQVLRYHRYLFDANVGLMHHCWYSDSARPGVAFWGRANGWALLAQVDLLDRLPSGHPMRDSLISLFRRHISGIMRYQGDRGLWRQILDRDDSYPETSCSAMFTFAIARGVNKGYLTRQYAENARRGWRGVKSKVRVDGQIEGICTGTGVGEDLGYYYRRPTPLDDPHGTGVVLLAGVEVMKIED